MSTFHISPINVKVNCIYLESRKPLEREYISESFKIRWYIRYSTGKP